MLGQGSYGSELRQRPPAPYAQPPYQQAHSLPPPPPPPPLYQQGPPRPFFQQVSAPPLAFQSPPSLAQPPFQQPLAIPPPPPRPIPPPPPPTFGVQPGQQQGISLPYQPQYAHERPVLQQTVQQPPMGNIGRPYLPPPPPPPPAYGTSNLVSVNQTHAPGGSSNPLLLPNQNMLQVPPYQHPSQGVRPGSLHPSQGQGVPVSGVQHFPMPPHPPPNIASATPAPFIAFMQGTTDDSQPPSSPPPPPPPLPSSPPPLPSSPPPDAGIQSPDTFVGNISEEEDVDGALPTHSNTFHGEAGHSDKVPATYVREETSMLLKPSGDVIGNTLLKPSGDVIGNTLLKPSGDVIQNESSPLQNEQILQNKIDGAAKLNDSDMDMEEDDDFSETDIEQKCGEFENRFEETHCINREGFDENDKLPISSRDISQHQHNNLLTTFEGSKPDGEVKASESESLAASTVINPVEIQSVVQENKDEFVLKMQFKHGSPLRQIQDYASDEDTEADGDDSLSDVSPVRTAEVSKDDTSEMHWSSDQVNISRMESQALGVPAAIDRTAETIQPDTSSLAPVSSSLRDVGGSSGFINDEQDNNADTETTVDVTTTTPKHHLENAVDMTCQVASSILEDKKLDSLVQKVDEFGRMIREGVSESDSESEHIRYNERYVRRGNGRSSPEVRRRRSRSPWHRTDKRSRSPSWSPRRERSRSRSPTSSRRVGESARHGRGQPPQCFNFLRGRCRYGSSCRYLHSDLIQNRPKHHQRGLPGNNSVKCETQRGPEKASEETITGQEHHSSPDMDAHDMQVCEDNIFEEKQLGQTAYGDEKAVLPCLDAKSPGRSVDIDNHTSNEILAVEPKEEDGKHHNLEESGQISVEQLPSPHQKLPDQATSSLEEALVNPLRDHIILQQPHGSSVLESLPLPDKKADAFIYPESEGRIFSNFPETTDSQPSNIPSDAISPYPSKPSGPLEQQLQPSQMNFPPSVGAPPAPILSSSPSTNFFPPPHHPSLPIEFRSADAVPRPSWAEVQPAIPMTGTYPLEFASNTMPPRNEFHVQTDIRPYPSRLDGVPPMRNYEIHQSSHSSVAVQQLLHRPAGTYQTGPMDAMHHESRTSFQPNALSLPPHANMMQGQLSFSPADTFQKNNLIFHNESSISRPFGGDFRPLSNTSHPQRPMHGLQGPIGSAPSIHGLANTLEPSFPSQSAGYPEYKQELLLNSVGMPKVASAAYYNPFASTFEQTRREPRYSASFIPNRDPFKEQGQWAASSSGPRSGAFFASLPGTTVSASYESISFKGHLQDQSAAPTFGALKHASDITTSKQYDPLSDSFDSLGTFLRKPDDNSQEKSIIAGTSVDVDNTILKTSVKPMENNQQHKVAVRPVSNFDDEVGETATDTEAGAVENGSPLLDDGKDWNPGVAAGDTGPDAVEIDQQPSPGKSKKGKDSRSMKLFKIAIANFVKEILKPSWRQGNMSKEAFKTIVKKTVDKVAGAMPNHQVPKTQAKIDQYVESSQRKLTKLVMGYVEKYVKT